ncbi:MAG: PD40 domain-containing protein [Cyclobacteriaceae bacterium]|nr:PD40 domain-containing protein [Cyclobacteriaceae bacterium]
MKLLTTTYLLVTVFLIGGMTPSFSQSPEQLFQKGLIKEEGEGSLNEAIGFYNKIVENPDADKSLQAKALLHVGLCYEKLGRNEATKAYQQLVNNFPGQKNEVAIARERLSRLIQTAEKVSQTPLVPKFTKIKIPTKPGNGVMSPDGKKLAYVSEKALWVLPIHGKTNPDITGEPTKLTESLGAWDLANMGIAWSANGKWLAFYVSVPGEDIINVIPAQGGKPQIVKLNHQRNNIRR